MGYLYNFEKLEVWSDARVFVKRIYSITKHFPLEEKFGLCSQIQRAAISIPSNLAEGMSRSSYKEQLRFVEIAYGSLMEICCQLYLSRDLQYLSNNDFDELKTEIDKISNKINALNRSIKKRLNE